MLIKNQNHKRTTLKKLILFILIALLIIGAIFIYQQNKAKDSSISDEQNTTPQSEAFNPEPPTAEEKVAGEQPQNQKVETTPEFDEQGKQKVQPIISTWVQSQETTNLELNGFVPSIVESGGKCLLRLKKDGQEVTKIKDARPDAQTTTCGILEVERSKLTSGVWVATVSYSSAKYVGTSNPVEVTIK